MSGVNLGGRGQNSGMAVFRSSLTVMVSHSVALASSPLSPLQDEGLMGDCQSHCDLALNGCTKNGLLPTLSIGMQEPKRRG